MMGDVTLPKKSLKKWPNLARGPPGMLELQNVLNIFSKLVPFPNNTNGIL